MAGFFFDCVLVDYERTQACQQLVLSFIGKFVAVDVQSDLTWLEAEAVRFSPRLLRPFTPNELSEHLRIPVRQARRILLELVENDFWL